MKLRWLLPVSILLNLILLALLAQALLNSPLPGAPQATQIPSATSFSPSPQQLPSQISFRWSQIESSDYPTFIANLRAVGCPEETIRHLVSSELQSAGVLTPAPGGGACQPQSFQPTTSTAQRKELVDRFLGTGPQTNPMGTAKGSVPMEEGASSQQPQVSLASSPSTAPALENPEIKMPLVFLPPPPEIQNDPAQLAQFEALKSQFITDIGGLDQNPADPAYLNRWLGAQANADDWFYTWFGQSAYTALVDQSAQQAAP